MPHDGILPPPTMYAAFLRFRRMPLTHGHV